MPIRTLIRILRGLRPQPTPTFSLVPSVSTFRFTCGAPACGNRAVVPAGTYIRDIEQAGWRWISDYGWCCPTCSGWVI